MLPELGGTVGVSRSGGSRRVVEASAERLRALDERSLKRLELLAIYGDGIVVDTDHVLGAIGVDAADDKHLLLLEPAAGCSENAPVVEDLPGGLVARGLDSRLKHLFVNDGSEALRPAIAEIDGDQAQVQRCRTRKLSNVLQRLPKQQRAQSKAVMNAARSSARPRPAWTRCDSSPSGWPPATPTRPPRCSKVSRRCSPSTGWGCCPR